MTVVKPNLGAHAGRANNRLGFDEAYAQILANSDLMYRTGNGTAFVVKATNAKKESTQPSTCFAS